MPLGQELVLARLRPQKLAARSPTTSQARRITPAPSEGETKWRPPTEARQQEIAVYRLQDGRITEVTFFNVPGDRETFSAVFAFD